MSRKKTNKFSEQIIRNVFFISKDNEYFKLSIIQNGANSIEFRLQIFKTTRISNSWYIFLIIHTNQIKGTDKIPNIGNTFLLESLKYVKFPTLRIFNNQCWIYS